MAYNNEKRPVHKTANGREFNMDQFRQKNELSPAVGNIKVNARGDELGPGGQVIKKRNEVLDEYYKTHGKSEETPVKSKTNKATVTPDNTKETNGYSIKESNVVSGSNNTNKMNKPKSKVYPPDTKATDTKATDTKATDTKATDTKATDTKSTDTKATSEDKNV